MNHTARRQAVPLAQEPAHRHRRRPVKNARAATALRHPWPRRAARPPEPAAAAE